jgi:hypothetical protein
VKRIRQSAWKTPQTSTPCPGAFKYAFCKSLILLTTLCIPRLLLTLSRSLNSSTPEESELIELNTLVLNAENFGVSQVIIDENVAATSGTESMPSVTVVDSQTMSVEVTLADDFILQLSAPQTIELLGTAKVQGAVYGTNESQLMTQFTLQLNYFEYAVRWSTNLLGTRALLCLTIDFFSLLLSPQFPGHLHSASQRQIVHQAPH